MPVIKKHDIINKSCISFSSSNNHFVIEYPYVIYGSCHSFKTNLMPLKLCLPKIKLPNSFFVCSSESLGVLFLKDIDVQIYITQPVYEQILLKYESLPKDVFYEEKIDEMNDFNIVNIYDADIDGFKRKCVFLKFNEIVDESFLEIKCITSGTYIGWCNYLFTFKNGYSFYFVNSLSFSKRFSYIPDDLRADYIFICRNTSEGKLLGKQKSNKNIDLMYNNFSTTSQFSRLSINKENNVNTKILGSASNFDSFNVTETIFDNLYDFKDSYLPIKNSNDKIYIKSVGVNNDNLNSENLPLNCFENLSLHKSGCIDFKKSFNSNEIVKKNEKLNNSTNDKIYQLYLNDNIEKNDKKSIDSQNKSTNTENPIYDEYSVKKETNKIKYSNIYSKEFLDCNEIVKNADYLVDSENKDNDILDSIYKIKNSDRVNRIKNKEMLKNEDYIVKSKYKDNKSANLVYNNEIYNDDCNSEDIKQIKEVNLKNFEDNNMENYINNNEIYNNDFRGDDIKQINIKKYNNNSPQSNDKKRNSESSICYKAKNSVSPDITVVYETKKDSENDTQIKKIDINSKNVHNINDSGTKSLNNKNIDKSKIDLNAKHNANNYNQKFKKFKENTEIKIQGINEFTQAIKKCLERKKIVVIPVDLTSIFLEIIIHLFYVFGAEIMKPNITVCSKIFNKLSVIVNIQSEWLNETFSGSVFQGKEPFSFVKYNNLKTYDSIFDIDIKPKILFLDKTHYEFLDTIDLFENQAIFSINKNIRKKDYDCEIKLETSIDEIYKRTPFCRIISNEIHPEIDIFSCDKIYVMPENIVDNMISITNVDKIDVYSNKLGVSFFVEGKIVHSDNNYQLKSSESFIKKLFIEDRYFFHNGFYFFVTKKIKVKLEKNSITIEKI